MSGDAAGPPEPPRRRRAGPRIGLGRSLLPIVLIGGVVLFVFAALVAAGRIGPGPALAGALAIVLVQALLMRAFLDGIAKLRQAIEEMSEATGEAEPAVRVSSLPAADLWLAVLRLRRAWRKRLDGLERELAGLDGVLAALPYPVLLVNDRREVLRINAAAQELFGEHALKRDLAAALRNPLVLDGVDAVLRGGGGRVVEFGLSVPVDRHFEASIVPLARRADDGYAALVALTDLTAIRRTEQMRADFVANASHELRTPLSTLIGFIETLSGPAADDPGAQRRFLAIMRREAARMAGLVDDLLALSRIELDEHLPPTGEVRLEPVLKGVAQSLELKAASRGMRIELALGSTPGSVVGNAGELAQVFQNLIDNAVKYARERTPITVSLAASAKLPHGLAVTVRDHGEGIERLHLPRLTERFYRVDTARSREMGGTGLGLAIVKHIVNRHRGVLEIESAVGEGSTFTVHLRAWAAAEERDRPVSPGARE